MRRIFLAILTAYFSFAGTASWAEEDEGVDYKARTVNAKEALQFRIPEDMPVETKGGVVSRASTEEYIYIKFKQLDKKLKGIEEKIDRLTKIALAGAGDKFKETSSDGKSKVLASH